VREAELSWQHQHTQGREHLPDGEQPANAAEIAGDAAAAPPPALNATAGVSLGCGREIQSMVFFSTAEMELLYSGSSAGRA
jgi:hypothetical protein